MKRVAGDISRDVVNKKGGKWRILLTQCPPFLLHQKGTVISTACISMSRCPPFLLPTKQSLHSTGVH